MNLIAEFGCNWNNWNCFVEMIKKSSEIGIEYVKMQLFDKTSPVSLWHMIINLYLARKMKKFAEEYGIILFFTPMYPEAVKICKEIGQNFYKIRYLDQKNKEILDAIYLDSDIKESNKLIFVSIQNLEDTIYSGNNIRYLYCVPEYPAGVFKYFPAIKTNKLINGVSDHTKSFYLFNHARRYNNLDWFEMHVCLDELCIEYAWSKKLDDLKVYLDGN